jgi:type IV secretory pathway VirB2 component (pilin)
MADYSVLAREGDNPGETAVFIREGFSWWAFVLPPLWALYHRHFVLAAILVLATVVLDQLAETLPNAMVWSVAMQFLFAVVIGFNAASLRKFFLQARHFRVISAVTADNSSEAEIHFFATLPAAKSSVPAPSQKPVSDILGLFAGNATP